MIRPFRFWCNKILPLVYDDSLSYYELLCKLYAYVSKVVTEVNTQGEAIDALNKALADLEEYVNQFFTNPMFDEALQDALDEMFESGELGTLIQNLANTTQFVDGEERRDKYKRDVAETIASYLSILHYNRCVQGGAYDLGGVKMVGEYSENRGYTQLLTVAPNRFSVEPTTIDGVSYNVLRADCTTWASIVTKCMKYADSPYYAKALNENTPEQTLIQLALDTNVHKDYTYDFMNRWTLTAALADSTGGRFRNAFYREGNDRSIVASIVATMETGDLLFFGSSNFSDRLLGIHHCGIFVKTLDELNQFMQSGQSVITMNGEHSDSGYVVHFSTSHGYSTEQYVDHLRVQTLEEMFDYDSDQSWSGVWWCRISASVLNSAKQLARTWWMQSYFDKIVFDSPSRPEGMPKPYINIQTGMMNFPYANVGSPGEIVADGSNLDNYGYNGTFVNRYSGYNIINRPDSNYPIFFLRVDGSNNGVGGDAHLIIQRYTGINSTWSDVKEWIRMRGNDPTHTEWTEWSPWILVSHVAQE